jgi:CMP-N,N'-diacetyllegionaminic acid synthase
MDSFAIILARGGSKGIKNKNLINVAGKPLIEWTIEHSIKCKYIKDVFVSSDSKEILDFSQSKGATSILRPSVLSQDDSSSEDAWAHALEYIQNKKGYLLDFIVAPQVTSPLRGFNDFSYALEKMKDEKLDSLLSVNELRDFFIWRKQDSKFISDNYDFKNRSRRQLINTKYHENGSFYIFKPEVLKQYKNRLGGKIGYYLMEEYKSFQIDEIEDLKLCEIIINGYELNEYK